MFSNSSEKDSSPVFKVGASVEKRSTSDKPDRTGQFKKLETAEPQCEGGVCAVNWKPQRPAA